MEEELYMEMIAYYAGDPKRIQHFMKVYALSKLIGSREKMDAGSYEILCAASLVHDIGIKKAEEQFGRCDGRLQEKLGPDIAGNMLKAIGFSDTVIERVCYLVGHHHTYGEIEGMDYQILVEADFLVNLYEDNSDIHAVKTAYERIFKTKTGKLICREMFGLEE